MAFCTLAGFISGKGQIPGACGSAISVSNRESAQQDEAQGGEADIVITWLLIGASFVFIAVAVHYIETYFLAVSSSLFSEHCVDGCITQRGTRYPITPLKNTKRRRFIFFLMRERTTKTTTRIFNPVASRSQMSAKKYRSDKVLNIRIVVRHVSRGSRHSLRAQSRNCRRGIRDRQRAHTCAPVHNAFLAESSARKAIRAGIHGRDSRAPLGIYLERVSGDGATSAGPSKMPNKPFCPPLSLSPVLTFEKGDLPGRRSRGDCAAGRNCVEERRSHETIVRRDFVIFRSRGPSLTGARPAAGP